MTVRTRFAPSPTGLLHIGGARTALFNYLFSRHHGGEYLLRIEDTDRARSTEEATQVILDGLAWLGLAPDAPPVFQSTRAARHVEVAHALLASGHAYRCFCTPQELAAMREAAAAAGRPPRYDGRWRDRDPAEAPPGVAPAIRLKAPRDGETVVDDLVQGRVRVANAELDDMIILRSDGSPTYLHAVVVDDHDMGITHVIRGDDHLTNTFRQVQIYQAMGWAPPRFAHIPLIHGADGAKLSKRHGAVSVLEFREQGYLPEALCNYLLRLGWGHGDAEVIGPGGGDRPVRPGRRRPRGVAHGLRQAHPSERDLSARGGRCAAGARGVGAAGSARRPGAWRHRGGPHPGTDAGAEGAREDLGGAGRFGCLPGPHRAAADGAEGRRGSEPGSADHAARTAPALAATDFSIVALDAALRAFAETTGRKLGQVAQPLRAALTGSTVSPGIDATLAALGRDEALARIAAVTG